MKAIAPGTPEYDANTANMQALHVALTADDDAFTVTLAMPSTGTSKPHVEEKKVCQIARSYTYTCIHTFTYGRQGGGRSKSADRNGSSIQGQACV